MPGNHRALRFAIKTARMEQGYKSDRELAKAAGIHLQTLQNWYSGATTPRPHQLSKVSRTLDKPMDWFMAKYEDRVPEAEPLHVALERLVQAVRELVEEIRAERDARNGSGPKTN